MFTITQNRRSELTKFLNETTCNHTALKVGINYVICDFDASKEDIDIVIDTISKLPWVVIFNDEEEALRESTISFNKVVYVVTKGTVLNGLFNTIRILSTECNFLYKGKEYPLSSL